MVQIQLDKRKTFKYPWTVYRAQAQKLHAYRHLQATMKISKIDKITNISVLDRAGLPSMIVNGGHANADEPAMAQSC